MALNKQFQIRFADGHGKHSGKPPVVGGILSHVGEKGMNFLLPDRKMWQKLNLWNVPVSGHC
jgi:hypothetical protein